MSADTDIEGDWVEWSETRPDGTWSVMQLAGSIVVGWEDCVEWPAPKPAKKSVSKRRPAVHAGLFEAAKP